MRKEKKQVGPLSVSLMMRRRPLTSSVLRSRPFPILLPRHLMAIFTLLESRLPSIRNSLTRTLWKHTVLRLMPTASSRTSTLRPGHTFFICILNQAVRCSRQLTSPMRLPREKHRLIWRLTRILRLRVVPVTIAECAR